MQALGLGGKSRRRLLALAVVALLGSFIALLAPAAPAASASSAGVSLAAGAVACTSAAHPSVAAVLARDIQSDNNAASTLWAGLGHSYLQHFLNLAGMRETVLGPGGAWGLTQVTAHDEMLLLRLLLAPNPVLSDNSRAYALSLMAQVIPSQRWGVPAGAPPAVTVHVKNGWLPLATHGWRINSIGGFTWPTGWYSIVVLSQDNPTMAYGITTVQAIAQVVYRDLKLAGTP